MDKNGISDKINLLFLSGLVRNVNACNAVIRADDRIAESRKEASSKVPAATTVSSQLINVT